MKLETFTITKVAKLSKNYNTIGTTISLTLAAEEGDTALSLNEQMNAELSKMVEKDLIADVRLLKL